MNVFITGGTSGIGLEFIRLYLNDGDSVGTCSFETERPKDLPPSVHYYCADVTVPEQIKKAITDFSKLNGSVDLVIANAGINHPKKNIPDFQRGREVIEVNVLGVINTFEPAINIMLDQGYGQLAAMGSLSGTIGLPAMAFYGASKAAVISFCESIGMDLQKHGITVTTLIPGFIKTPLVIANDHSMPFMVDVHKAVLQMKKAIEKKKTSYAFPWSLKVVCYFLKLLPRQWYSILMGQDYLGLGHQKEKSIKSMK
ncbi:MAG: SDR family NAD(P)-dependent oxidoreductase [Halobacteriovoraceae bacterium]|nr:SDR family NAD(P)-dependent oxidoreductase [Halobacteriovoraceae bacterium]MCB9095248.1 SDR family NAD(P)-dependent oxidoreductase [Halobacteriovoraceae bacterium]